MAGHYTIYCWSAFDPVLVLSLLSHFRDQYPGLPVQANNAEAAISKLVNGPDNPKANHLTWKKASKYMLAVREMGNRQWPPAHAYDYLLMTTEASLIEAERARRRNGGKLAGVDPGSAEGTTAGGQQFDVSVDPAVQEALESIGSEPHSARALVFPGTGGSKPRVEVVHYAGALPENAGVPGSAMEKGCAVVPLLGRPQDIEALYRDGLNAQDARVLAVHDEDGHRVVLLMPLTMPDGSPTGPRAVVPPDVAEVFDRSAADWRAYAKAHRSADGQLPAIPPNISEEMDRVVALIRAHQARRDKRRLKQTEPFAAWPSTGYSGRRPYRVGHRRGVRADTWSPTMSNTTLRSARGRLCMDTARLTACEMRLVLWGAPKDEKLPARLSAMRSLLPWRMPSPAKFPRKFEKPDKVEAEDRRRINILRRMDKPRLTVLADRLDALDFHANEPTTMASSRFMRVGRIRVIQSAAALLEAKLVMGRLYFVTIIPPAWFVPEEELQKCNPRAMLRQLRAHLLRAGSADSLGLIIGHLEAAYCRQKTTNKLGFAFHVHLVCDDNAELVIRRMGAVRSFAPSTDVRQPLRIEALRDDDLHSVLGYCFMAFWRNRAIDEHPEGLDDVKLPAGRGLPAKAACREWLWRHNRSLAELSLVVGTRNLSRAFRHTWL